MTTISKILFAIEARTTDPGVLIPLSELAAAVGPVSDYETSVADLIEQRFLMKEGANVCLTTDGARQVRVLNSMRH